LNSVHLYRRIKKEELNKQEITELLGIQNSLLDLRKQVELYNNHIWHLHSKKVQLEKEIDGLRTKIDNFDGVSSL
jgi:predicted RNase H-like nuclease (RuvC/YqgF family)